MTDISYVNQKNPISDKPTIIKEVFNGVVKIIVAINGIKLLDQYINLKYFFINKNIKTELDNNTNVETTMIINANPPIDPVINANPPIDLPGECRDVIIIEY